MSQSILHIKQEELDTAEKRGKYAVSIIGCGQIGILHAYLLAEAGFKVTCADADQAIINLLKKGKTLFLKDETESRFKTHVKTGRLTATNDVKSAVSQSDVIVITVPLKIDEKKNVNHSDVENICKQVGANLRRGSLVIFMGIAGFGFVETRLMEILENTSGYKVGDFGFAYCPIHTANAQSLEMLVNQERIVAAFERDSLNSASTILGIIIKRGVRKVSNMRIAELAALFGITQRHVSVFLANEFAILCEKAGVDFLEIRNLLAKDNPSVMPLPTLEGNAQREACLLLADAENLGVKLRISPGAREINAEMIKHAVNLAKDALKECGKPLRRARIALLGIAQIPNTKSLPKTAGKELAEMLETRGAKISLHDPYFSDSAPPEMPYPFKKNITEVLEGTDCAIILTGHDQFKRLNLKKLKLIMKKPAAIVDLEGIFEPDKIEKEGFIYRGLGRGVWKK